MSDTSLIERGDKLLPGKPPMVSRYRLYTRVNHWVTAVSMVLLVFSGLAMFHPSLFFLTVLFGGGQNVRALHPWFGLVLTVSFLAMFFQFWRTNLWHKFDTAWMAHIVDLVLGHEERMPEVGKYNAGQKLVFWGMGLMILVLLATGIISWEEYFPHLTSVDVQRLALWAHSLAAIGVILILIVHVAAAIWTRGSFDAMISGLVPIGWAWRHHRKWFRQLAGGATTDRKQPGG